jgi:membrane protease YdiL (CAAX protease family)
MQTYLKSKSTVVQLLIFMGLAAAGAVILLGFGGFALSAITGTSLEEMGNPARSHGPVSDTTLWNLRMLVLFQFLGLFAIPSYVFARLSDPNPVAYLGLRAPWRRSYWLLGSVILVASIPLVEYTGLLNRQIHFSAGLAGKIAEMEKSAAATLQLLLERRSIGNLLINLLFIAVFAGVGEELFFRGILQRLLIRSLRSPLAGIIVSALCFSFFHFQFYGFVPRFILGALLGAAYWYSGSLWVAVLAHTLFDAIQLIMAWFHPELVTSDSVLNTTAAKLLPAALISAVLTGILLWIMKRHSRTRFSEVYAGERKGHPLKTEILH